MKIINKLSPQGYCYGVNYALKIIDEAISNPNTLRPIYMLGNIIHNKLVINEYVNKDIIILNDKGKTRLELLNEINNGTIIISAHGASPKVFEYAKEKGLNIIDATCFNIKKIHNRIKEYLNLNYDCIYIGTNGHPECEGVLGISDKIHFISSLKDLKSLNVNKNLIYITNQTTLSYLDLKEIYDYAQTKFENLVIDNKICGATLERQLAVINQNDADLCIVVGDPTSSNTKKLVGVSKIKTIFCESLASLDLKEISNANVINITSGASTPAYLVDEIIEYISNM